MDMFRYPVEVQSQMRMHSVERKASTNQNRKKISSHWYPYSSAMVPAAMMISAVPRF